MYLSFSSHPSCGILFLLCTFLGLHIHYHSFPSLANAEEFSISDLEKKEIIKPLIPPVPHSLQYKCVGLLAVFQRGKISLEGGIKRVDLPMEIPVDTFESQAIHGKFLFDSKYFGKELNHIPSKHMQLITYMNLSNCDPMDVAFWETNGWRTNTSAVSETITSLSNDFNSRRNSYNGKVETTKDEEALRDRTELLKERAFLAKGGTLYQKEILDKMNRDANSAEGIFNSVKVRRTASDSVYQNEFSLGRPDYKAGPMETGFDNLIIYCHFLSDHRLHEGNTYTFMQVGKVSNHQYESIHIEVSRHYSITPPTSFEFESTFTFPKDSPSLNDVINIGKGTYGKANLNFNFLNQNYCSKWIINIGAFVSIAPDVNVILARPTDHTFNPISTYPWTAIHTVNDPYFFRGIDEAKIKEYEEITQINKQLASTKPNSSHISQYNMTSPHTLNNDLFPDFPGCYQSYSVTIGNDVWIGFGATIINDITVGDGAIIGAFSVVRDDVPPYAVVAGNPAVVIKYRYSKDVIEKLLKTKWWTLPDETILQSKYFAQRGMTQIPSKLMYKMYTNMKGNIKNIKNTVKQKKENIDNILADIQDIVKEVETIPSDFVSATSVM